MAKHRPGKKGAARYVKAALVLMVLAVLGLVGWNTLAPTLAADSVTLYESYTAQTGDIQTTLSFSATLDVKNSKTYTSGEMTKVKELYVASGDEVKEGDALVLLTNGELLTAGFDGVVNEIRYNVGDWVRPNASLVQVCDLVNLEVTMEVDEYDVKALAVGQACTVGVISLGIEFETAIGHINRVSASSGTVAYYTVTCDVTVPAEVLPGMRATVSISSEKALGVTVLPIGALAFDEDGGAYTLRLSADGTYERQAVETGLSDGMSVEITGGVKPGDTVYAADGKQSADGGFSLADIYRSLVGEKVVINQAGGQMSGSMQMSSDWQGELPSGMEGQAPAGFDGQMPQAVDTGGAGDDASVSFADLPQPDTTTTENNP